MRKHVQRPSPALVVASIALFVALGGTGYAAVKINGKNIKDKTIAGKKLKNATLAAGKIKANTLTGAQINEATLGRVPDATSATTAGTAATVVPGAVKAGGLGKIVTRESAPVNLINGLSEFAEISCAPGEIVLSGGAAKVTTGSDDFDDTVAITSSRKNPTGQGWGARVTNANDGPSTIQFVIQAYCLQT